MPEQQDRVRLQSDLLEVFRRHGVAVGVGLTAKGVAIRSQDDRVDALNLGGVRALETDTSEGGSDR